MSLKVYENGNKTPFVICCTNHSFPTVNGALLPFRLEAIRQLEYSAY
jgi:hypothetical protein